SFRLKIGDELLRDLRRTLAELLGQAEAGEREVAELRIRRNLEVGHRDRSLEHGVQGVGGFAGEAFHRANLTCRESAAESLSSKLLRCIFCKRLQFRITLTSVHHMTHPPFLAQKNT